MVSSGDYQARGGGVNDLERWLRFLLEAWSSTVEVFLRSGFGKRYLGLQAAIVLLLIPLYSAMWEHCDLRPMFWYLIAYLALCAAHRLDTLRYKRNGALPTHSRYSGRPLVMKFLPNRSEVWIKRTVEPLCVLAAGLGFLKVYAPLGVFWIVAAASMRICICAAEHDQQMRATEMYDAVLDQQDVAERFRDMRGDRF